MLAQGAVAAIRSGCQLLKDGKELVGEVKQAVGDAQDIVKEVTGFSGWLRSLFGKSEQKVTQNKSKSVVKTIVKKAPTSYEEYQLNAVHDICSHLKVFYESQRQLMDHIRVITEEAKTTTKIEDVAIDKLELEWQLRQLSVQIREAMIYTPKELGLADLYTQFLETYGQIEQDQEFAQEEKARQARNMAWQREHRREILIYKGVYLVAILLGMLEIIGLYSVI